MTTRVLETILTGRDQLTPVLARAAASVEAFDQRVENSDTAAARSSTNAARVHQAAAKSAADSVTRVHAAAGQFESAGADLGDRLGKGMTRGVEANHGRFGEALRKQVDSAIKALPQVNLLNLGVQSTAEMDRLRRELESLSTKRIGIDLSAEDATREVDRLRVELLALGRDTPHIQLKADTAAAAAELARFRATIAKVGDGAGRDFSNSLDRALGPAMGRIGDDSGGTLSRGMSMAVLRNSPLIVAGIGAALAVGAPALLASATLLFGGIGIVAAAQSKQVQAAWGATWNTIVTGTESAATIMQSSLVGMANRVTAGFQQLRPQLEHLFAAAGPQLAGFVDDLVQATQNAMPGFVQAVQSAQPVMTGLGNLVKSLGSGLGDFFGDLSQHASSAGQVFTQIGQAVQSILPILSTLIGAGTEVAAGVLPMITGALSALSSVVQFVAPVLPTVATGLLGFKVGDMAAGWLGKAAGAVGSLGDAMGGSEADAGAFSSALSFVGDHAGDISEKAGPLLGAAISAVTIIMSAASEQAQTWADAIRKGGAAADEARAQMNDLGTAFATANDSWGGAVAGLVGFNAQQYLATSAIGQTKDALKAQWEAMTPLQQAQSKVAEWTATLSSRMTEFGSGSDEARAAQERLAFWTKAQAAAQSDQNSTVAAFVPAADAAKTAMDDLTLAIAQQNPDLIAEALDRYTVASQQAARDQNALEMAIRGVTAAMADQTNQARSRVDAQFAYQDAVDSTQGALAALQDAQAHLNDTNKDTRTSLEDVDDAARAYNESLSNQVTQAGRVASSNLPGTMDDTQKAILGAKGELNELNKIIASGVQLPPELEAYRQQLIQITGQADGAKLAQAQLAAAVGDLGFAVTSLPDGETIQITAPTDALLQQLYTLGFTVTTLPDGSVTVSADTEEAKGNLGTLSDLLVGYTNSNPTATASLNTAPLEDGWAHGMGLVAELDAQTPTPAAGLDHGLFDVNFGAVTANIVALHGQRPTPVAGLATGPFNINWAAVSGNLTALGARSVAPTVGVTDQASGRLQTIGSLLAGLHDRTVTVTTVQRVLSVAQSIGGGLFGAQGGIFTPMAQGGIMPLAAGGVAGVYRPNTPVLIGDNRRVPESYVPQDGSGRSWEILRRTITGMVAATGYRPPDFAPAAMPGYGSAGGRGGMAGAVQVGLSLAGAVITGQFRLDSDGMVRLVDGRIDGKLGDLADTIHYNS